MRRWDATPTIDDVCSVRWFAEAIARREGVARTRDMHQEEWLELTNCLDCGEPIVPERDRAFAVSEEGFLCFECAERRGGVYDADTERWTAAPDVTGEPDERRPHP